MGLVWPLIVIVLAVEAAIWLASRRYGRARPAWARTITLVLALSAVPVLALFAYVRVAPLPPANTRLETPGTVVLGADGVVLQRDQRDGLRIPVALDDVAPVVIDATIAAEDQRFYDHPGIDPFAIARAVTKLPWERSGASTLTQQLARRLYIDDADTPLLARKAEEALLALQLEARYSKDEILSLYLNEVYYGNGAYGIEAASRLYFGVSARHLDLAQAAYLAGLPQRPGAYGEVGAGEAEARQSYVLERMAATGRITAAEASLAAAEALMLLPAQSNAIAPHFVTYALEELARVAPALAETPGLVVETTLDAGLQREAESNVAHQLAALAGKDVSSAAVVVLEPATGRLLAMVGSADFYDEERDGQVNVALSPRQPGSALKPFLYAAAFERGYTAASMLLDVPSSFSLDGAVYEPLNYDRRFHGPLPLRVALASSLNVPAVRTLDAIGVEAFLEVSHRFGLRTLTDAEVYGLSLTLGGGEVRLLDLTGAYGAIANEGLLAAPYAIERVWDASGQVVYEHVASQPSRATSPEHAFILADILSDADARELGFGYAPSLRLPFRAAVKTGTTTEFRDNWTVGFTPERAVGVWVGNADNSPMRNVSGLDGAGPIWHGVMQAAMAGVTPSWPAPPEGLVRTEVCAPTGELPGAACPATTQEWFVAGTQPEATEDYYVRGEDGRLLIDPPSEARAWAATAGLALAKTETHGQDAFVLQPAPGTVLFVAGELQSQTVLLRASPPPGAVSIDFTIDGAHIGSASVDDPNVVWNLSTGEHVLEVRALMANGQIVTARSNFEVRG